MQAERAEEQTTTVIKLRNAVAAGEADEAQLAAAEGALTGLQGSLEYLRGEMAATLRGADFAFRRGLVGTQVVRSLDPICGCRLAGLRRAPGLRLGGIVSFAAL